MSSSFSWSVSMSMNQTTLAKGERKRSVSATKQGRKIEANRDEETKKYLEFRISLVERDRGSRKGTAKGVPLSPLRDERRAWPRRLGLRESCRRPW